MSRYDDIKAKVFLEKAKQAFSAPQEHARLCANYINSFWADRGFDPEARVESEKVTAYFTVFKVVSNMVNGYPTKRVS